MARWLSWLERRPVTAEVDGSNPFRVASLRAFYMDGFPSGQRGQTVNLLSLTSVVRIHLHPLRQYVLCRVIYTTGVLAQLGEHLPYKQRVTGSSPVGPISILSRDGAVW